MRFGSKYFFSGALSMLFLCTTWRFSGGKCHFSDFLHYQIVSDRKVLSFGFFCSMSAVRKKECNGTVRKGPSILVCMLCTICKQDGAPGPGCWPLFSPFPMLKWQCFQQVLILSAFEFYICYRSADAFSSQVLPCSADWF